MKRYSWIVNSGASAKKAQAFIRDELPLLPESALNDAFKRRDVKLNGIRIGPRELLKAGDEICLFTDKSETEIPVLYEDEAFLIVNKPAGVNSDPNSRSGFSLLSWAENRSHHAYQPELCHRLDNQTSGILLIAKNENAAETAREAFKTHSMVKRYECLVAGCPPKPQAVREAYLKKDALRAQVSIRQSPCEDYKMIKTEYRVLEAGEISRLEVTLHTGRTHQIRAHLAFLGFPVLGDDLYGKRELNKAMKAHQLKLCATELVFSETWSYPQPLTKRFRIKAPF